MYNEKKELDEFEIEKKVLQNKNNIYQNNIVDSLINNGLGNEIRQTLKNPIKLSKFDLFKIKVNNFLNKLFDIL